MKATCVLPFSRIVQNWQRPIDMSFFDSLSQFITAASIEIQTAIDETGTLFHGPFMLTRFLAQGWDEFVEDVSTAISEFDPSLMPAAETEGPGTLKKSGDLEKEKAQLAAYAVAAGTASRTFSIVLLLFTSFPSFLFFRCLCGVLS